MLNEIWEDIGGYEGLYQVSNTGKVRSVDRRIVFKDGRYATYKGKVMKTAKRHQGYRGICLSKDDKQKAFLVHRLVAEAFIPNPSKLPLINHIDENKSNNRADNLEWCNHKYNANYGNVREKMSNTRKNNMYNQKTVICIETKEIYVNSCEAERQTGIPARSIRKVCEGSYKRAGGYTWQWVC